MGGTGNALTHNKHPEQTVRPQQPISEAVKRILPAPPLTGLARQPDHVDERHAPDLHPGGDGHDLRSVVHQRIRHPERPHR